MLRNPDVPGRPGPLASYLRPPAIAASWLALVAVGSGFFFAPRGAEVQPSIDDVVGFGCSMAIASAAAATASFGVGGRRRWAVELTISVAILSSLVVLLLVYFLWIDPTLARRWMNLWAFRGLQHRACRWAEQLAGYHGPLGATLGIVFGTVAGLLTRLGRHRPRLATGTALGLLFGFASGAGRQFALGLMTWLSWRLRYHVVPWSISDDQISITGMILGAIAGAVVAGLAMYATRPTGPGHAWTRSQ
jgi:hypothetical protein